MGAGTESAQAGRHACRLAPLPPSLVLHPYGFEIGPYGRFLLYSIQLDPNGLNANGKGKGKGMTVTVVLDLSPELEHQLREGLARHDAERVQ